MSRLAARIAAAAVLVSAAGIAEATPPPRPGREGLLAQSGVRLDTFVDPEQSRVDGAGLSLFFDFGLGLALDLAYHHKPTDFVAETSRAHALEVGLGVRLSLITLLQQSEALQFFDIDAGAGFSGGPIIEPARTRLGGGTWVGAGAELRLGMLRPIPGIHVGYRRRWADLGPAHEVVVSLSLVGIASDVLRD